MSNCYRNYPNYRPNNPTSPAVKETEAESNARAFAYNRNLNLLIAPNDNDSPCVNNSGNPDLSSKSNTMEGILSRFIPNNDNEDKAIAEAEGKAIIRNTNINVCVRD